MPFLKFISNDHRPEIAAKFAQKSLQRSPSRSPQRSRRTLTNLSTFRFSFGSHALYCVHCRATLFGHCVRMFATDRGRLMTELLVGDSLSKKDSLRDSLRDSYRTQLRRLKVFAPVYAVRPVCLYRRSTTAVYNRSIAN